MRITKIILMLVLLLNGCGGDPNVNRVIGSWVNALAPLYIVPVFPPREDVHVGDIYLLPGLTDEESLIEALSTNEVTNQRLIPIFLASAFAIADEDNTSQSVLFNALTGHYAQRPSFQTLRQGLFQASNMETGDNPSVLESLSLVVPIQPEFTGDSNIFSETELVRPRIVSFPEYVSIEIDAADFSGVVPIQGFLAGLGFGIVDDSRVEVSIPSAESIGIPVPVLMDIISYRCPRAVELAADNEESRRHRQNGCVEVENGYYQPHPDLGIDPQLLAFSVPATLGSELIARYRSETIDGRQVDTLPLRISIISEVYYARALDVTIRRDQLVAAQGNIEPITVSLRQRTCNPGDSGTPVPTDDGASSDTDTAEDIEGSEDAAVGSAVTGVACFSSQTDGTISFNTANLEEALAALQGRISPSGHAVPGGSLSIASATSETVTVRRAFSRPVAIGYKSAEVLLRYRFREVGLDDYLDLFPAFLDEPPADGSN